MAFRGSDIAVAPITAGAGSPALAVQGIAKSYGTVQALAPTSLELAPGEVHALVGENGSGKSTLVGIVSGTVKTDAGSVRIAGKACTRGTPTETQALGALTVFQDGSVFPELTVAQNLYLGTPSDRRPGYRDREAWAARRLGEVGLGTLPVGARAQTLSPADRQLLEIVRALMADPAVLLLDEATSALDAAGVDRALALTRAAADRGTAVLFVTHRLTEVFRVADRISVLRDGRWEGSYDVDAVDAERLVELMAGTSVDQEFPERAGERDVGEPLLGCSGLGGERFGPVDLRVRAGEIVGIAGADGNGQQQLLRGLAGVDPTSGRLEVGGRRIGNYASAVRAGLLLLSGDRRHESLFAPLPVRENLAVGVLGRLGRCGVVSRSRETSLVDELVGRFDIQLASPEQPVTALSGGNQQKVALGRALATEPRVLIVDEPTQGVDVRSRMDIYRTLRESARRGLAVVVNSSDASELTGLCDRILVVSRGRIVTELPGVEATEGGVVGAFAGAEQARSPVSDAASELNMRRPLVGAWRLAAAHENGVRVLALLALVLLLGAYAQSETPTFLSTESLFNVFLLTVPLATVAAAQFVVLYVGGIDISVGATMGVTVAVMSFVVGEGSPFLEALLLSLGVAIVVGGVVGAVNAALIEAVRLSPVIATIATLGILSGFGLVLRPTPEGLISTDLGEALTTSVWAIPWVLIAVLALLVVGDWLLRSTGHGLRLRSVGLNATFAYRLGVRTTRMRVVAYVVCAFLAALAGVFLSAQVGIGDPGVGEGFTLLAIAAPVLGGASLFGGFGTFAGTLLGAVLLVLAQTLTTVLGIDQAYGFILTGGLTLLGLLAYSAGAGSALKRAWRRSASALPSASTR